METKKYLCLDNYVNYDGLTCFKKNNIYFFKEISKNIFYTEKNELGCSHELDNETIKGFFSLLSKEQMSENIGQLETAKKDLIVESVVNQFKERSEVGIKKYNTTLDRTDLSTLDWINHAQQEAMDFVLYLERLKKEYENNGNA